jgi:nitroreductase
MNSDDFLNLAKLRFSVRRYLDRPVPHDLLDRCLEAARLAPSATNAQPCSYILVDDPSLRESLARLTFSTLVSFNRWTLGAPAILVVLNQPSALARVGATLQGRSWFQVDTGIAAAHFCLQATAEGLGTCILGWFDEAGVRRLLKIPRNQTVALLITVGFPAEEPRPKQRKSLEVIRHYNQEGS